jgi:hypothetical protein
MRKQTQNEHKEKTKMKNTITKLTLALGVVAALAAARPAPLFAAPGGGTVTPMLVKDVDQAARQPFQFTAMYDSVQNGENAGNSSAFTVPAGKRLVIEQVSVRLVTPGGKGQAGSFYIATKVGGVTASHSIPLVYQGAFSFTPSRDTFNASAPGQLYATRTAGFDSTYFDSFTVFVGISGYYVDVP